MKHTPSLSNEELAVRFRNGDRSAFDQLLDQTRRLIYKVARRYIAYLQTSDIDDLFQEGCIILLRSAQLFDPSRGGKFSTYLVAALQRRFRRYTVCDGLIHTPSTPIFQMAIEKARHLVSLDRPINGKNENGKDRTLGRLLAARAARVDGVSVFFTGDYRGEAMKYLPPRYAAVLELRLSGFAYHEIGAQLGVSGSRVQQLQAAAIKSIRSKSG